MLWTSTKRPEDTMTVQSYYYSSLKSFETSLDVYKPANQNNTKITGPTVVLVVGSGWMGHAPWIYYGTSWWNQSGPRSIASTGSVCICVRHPGAFFHIPSEPPSLGTSLWLLPVTVLVSSSIMMGISYSYSILLEGMLVILGLLLVWAFLWYSSRGDAQFEDMVESVAQAVRYIDRSREEWDLPKDQPLLFGGYSSGAHVATTLLQRWDKYDNLPSVDGVVLVSGVLAVRPSTKDDPRPRWLTDLVMSCVWGPAADKIPSPVNQDIPKLPHLLIGCHSETFGLPVLDVFFASNEYAEKAKAHNVHVKLAKIHSDHWNILASRAFQEVLVRELPLLSKRL